MNTRSIRQLDDLCHTRSCHIDNNPRLVLDSPEPGSGKPRVLEALGLLCKDAEMILSPTTAALFRLHNEKPIIVLFDETAATFNHKNAANYEDLRALQAFLAA